VQAAINDLQRFGRTVKLKAFQPFTTAENALENMNAVSEHVLTDDLKVRTRGGWRDTADWPVS
jgi:nucleolar protein 56